jgi:hypothetical protein
MSRRFPLPHVDNASLRACAAHLDFMSSECEQKRYFGLCELFHDLALPVRAEIDRRERAGNKAGSCRA